MEAAITEDRRLSPAVSRLFEEIPDPRMIRVAVERAACRSVKSIAADLGVDESTIYGWRANCPQIDQLAKQLALESVSDGALELLASFPRAVKVITGIMDDPTARPSDRLNAASQVVRNVVKVAAAQGQQSAAAGRDPLDDVGDADLVELIRTTRRLGKGDR